MRGSALTPSSHLFKDPDRDRRQCFRFPARLDDGESRPGEREQQGGHPRAGDGHMQPDAARGGLAPQFLADDPPRPQQTLEAADIDGHQFVAVPFVAWRELLRDVDERAR